MVESNNFFLLAVVTVETDAAFGRLQLLDKLVLGYHSRGRNRAKLGLLRLWCLSGVE
jgi:hypothetical protein